MPQGAPCPGILDRMDLKDWPRRQGYSAGCLDGYCQVIFFFIEFARYLSPRLHAILIYTGITLLHLFDHGICYRR